MKVTVGWLAALSLLVVQLGADLFYHYKLTNNASYSVIATSVIFLFCACKSKDSDYSRVPFAALSLVVVALGMAASLFRDLGGISLALIGCKCVCYAAVLTSWLLKNGVVPKFG